MKAINKIIVFSLCIVSLSCEDILEKDITNDTIQTISPTNTSEVVSNVVNFQWNSLKGANKYRVQVYGTNQNVILDSLVNNTNLSYPLTQGQYQWKVRGENSAYQSSYSSTSNFSRIISNDLSTQQVVLSLPTDKTYTNNTNIRLSWQTLATATSYRVEVVTENGDVIYPINNNDPDLSSTTLSVVLNNTQLTREKKYIWMVKAKNSTTMTETQFTTWSFYVDRTAPNQPINNFPANLAEQNVATTPINFVWTASLNNGNDISPISYQFELSNSEVFSTITYTSQYTPALTHSKILTLGVYYWRVRARDGALNESISTPHKLTIK